MAGAFGVRDETNKQRSTAGVVGHRRPFARFKPHGDVLPRPLLARGQAEHIRMVARLRNKLEVEKPHLFEG